jgi:methylamine dehydrogenase light chain
MKWLDRFSENSARTIARQSSRRSFVARLGTVMLGAAAVPLLPVARASESSRPPAPEESGDPGSCDYWRYCAIDGFLCDCCGGSYSSCPPGTTVSPITWIGTCTNPVDGKDYIISYNDCCATRGTSPCTCRHCPMTSTGVQVLRWTYPTIALLPLFSVWLSRTPDA